MKHLLILVFTFKSLCLFAQSEKNQKAKDTVNVLNNVYEQFSDLRLETDSIKLKIDFNSITKLEFETYEELYERKVDTIAKLISRTENSFQIRASDTIFEFSTRADRTFWYQGFYPRLNSYLVGVSGAGICEMFFIDKNSANGLLMPEFYDSGCNQPMISPDNRFLMTYGTCPEGNFCFDYYDHISTILIIDLKHVESIMDLKTFRFSGINDFVIENLFWIGTDEIVLKVFDEIAFDNNGQDYKKNIRYLKGKIEW
ncbi:hypothetical protein [Psychroserpens mesophilus]|uniref:hypothetical protein n=1 Tax=Psychroserpens mesophilus TaxID=325473 RepID=UPI000590B8C2|nr:hypothetical protein [Psychroserpens mesophilus]